MKGFRLSSVVPFLGACRVGADKEAFLADLQSLLKTRVGESTTEGHDDGKKNDITLELNGFLDAKILEKKGEEEGLGTVLSAFLDETERSNAAVGGASAEESKELSAGGDDESTPAEHPTELVYEEHGASSNETKKECGYYRCLDLCELGCSECYCGPFELWWTFCGCDDAVGDGGGGSEASSKGKVIDAKAAAAAAVKKSAQVVETTDSTNTGARDACGAGYEDLWNHKPFSLGTIIGEIARNVSLATDDCDEHSCRLAFSDGIRTKDFEYVCSENNGTFFKNETIRFGCTVVGVREPRLYSFTNVPMCLPGICENDRNESVLGVIVESYADLPFQKGNCTVELPPKKSSAGRNNGFRFSTAVAVLSSVVLLLWA